MLRYRVLYRKLHSYTDTIFDLFAKDVADLTVKLPERGVELSKCKHVFVHEYQEYGKVKEVITYEHEEDKVTNKPRIKLRNRPRVPEQPTVKLSGKYVTEGLWTAYEVCGA